MGLLKEVAERAVELIGRSAPRDLPQRLIRDVMSGKTHVIRTIDRDPGVSQREPDDKQVEAHEHQRWKCLCE